MLPHGALCLLRPDWHGRGTPLDSAWVTCPISTCVHAGAAIWLQIATMAEFDLFRVVVQRQRALLADLEARIRDASSDGPRPWGCLELRETRAPSIEP